MSVKWVREPAPVVRFASWSKPGEMVKGSLLAYQPQHGAQTYDRSQEVGCVILGQSDGSWVKVALDKGQLATAVNHAVVQMAEAHAAKGANFRPHLAIKYEGDGDKGHKVFVVRYGFEEVS